MGHLVNRLDRVEAGPVGLSLDRFVWTRMGRDRLGCKTVALTSFHAWAYISLLDWVPYLFLLLFFHKKNKKLHLFLSPVLFSVFSLPRCSRLITFTL